MEAPPTLPTNGGLAGGIATEKFRVDAGRPASHVQLACRAPHCAFPVGGTALCVRSTADPAQQVRASRLLAESRGAAGAPGNPANRRGDGAAQQRHRIGFDSYEAARNHCMKTIFRRNVSKNTSPFFF